MGDSLTRIRAFPSGARQDAGFQIDKVQRGENPDDWKSVKTIGKSVREIRIKEADGQYRVILFNRPERCSLRTSCCPNKKRDRRESRILIWLVSD